MDKRFNEIGRVYLAILDRCKETGKNLHMIETKRWHRRHRPEKIQYVYDNTDIIEELEQQVEHEPCEGIFKEKWMSDRKSVV